MRTLPAALIAEKNKISSGGAWVILLEVEFPGEPIIYLAHNNEQITWNGNTWEPFEFKLDTVTEDGKGSLPSYKITISNIGRELVSLLDQNGGGAGGTVTVRVVNSSLLAETVPAFIDVATITACDISLEWVTFTLGAESPLAIRSPRDRYLANHCRYKEFKGVQCGYAGLVGTCDRTFSTCKSLDNSLRFGGFPGIGLGEGIYV